jgi:hypothetical protein
MPGKSPAAIESRKSSKHLVSTTSPTLYYYQSLYFVEHIIIEPTATPGAFVRQIRDFHRRN